jgi:hypothetical protein
MYKEKSMNRNKLLNKLSNIAHAYHWDIYNDNRILATIQSGDFKGFKLNPITALAHKAGLGFFNNTREDTEYAARLLGISRSKARRIYSAILASYNHGDTQVVRGKIRSALEV